MTIILKVDWTKDGPPKVYCATMLNRGRALRWLCSGLDRPIKITRFVQHALAFRYGTHAQVVFNPLDYRMEYPVLGRHTYPLTLTRKLSNETL